MLPKNYYAHQYLRSIAAGLIVGLTGAATMAASATIESAAVALLVRSLIFPIGLILIAFCNHSLFTDCVVTCAELSWKDYSKTLGVVYAGNFLGVLVAASLASFRASPQMLTLARTIAETKCELDIFALAALAFGCNLLTGIGIFNAKKYETTLSKIAILFATMFLFMICNMEHSVTNMFFLLFGKLYADAEISISAILYNLLMVTLFNFLGGVASIYCEIFSVWKNSKKSCEKTTLLQ